LLLTGNHVNNTPPAKYVTKRDEMMKGKLGMGFDDPFPLLFLLYYNVI